MLALAELRALGAGQDQRVACGQIRPRQGTDERFLEDRQRRITVIEKGLRVELDLSCRRGQAMSGAVCHFGVFAVTRLERESHTGGMLAKRLERDAGGAELIAISGIDVAIPEVGAKPEPAGEIEDDLRIG